MMWTSQSEAEEAIGNQINVRTLKPYSQEADYANAKSYHTNHVSQLITSSQTNLMKWVSYKAGSDFIEENDIDTGEEALAITEINVWLFNTPRTYKLNIYGAKKLTHYWGELLTTNYDVSSHKLNETQKKEWDYTVDYTNRFFAKAEQRIKDGTKGAFYETASLKAKLFDSVAPLVYIMS